MLEFEKSKYSAVHDLGDGVATPPHAKPQRSLSMCQAGCDVHGSPVLQRYPVCGGSEQNSHCVYPAYKFKGSLISTGNFEQNSRASKYQKKEVELGSQSWMACLVASWMACLVASWMACLVASWMTCLVARWMACLVASWMACLVASWMTCLVASWMACLVASWMACLLASWMTCLVASWMACLVASWMACLVASWMACLVASWMACLVARCSSKVALVDTGFVPLFHTAVERANCRVHKVLHTGGVPTSLTLIVLWS